MADIDALIEGATLTRQSYGIAVAQGAFGGPRGIWLECKTCPASHVISGSSREEWEAVPTERAAEVFVRHGWTGEGPTLKSAHCPACSTQKVAA
jgi:predicted amidohydrolase YtcJ